MNALLTSIREKLPSLNRRNPDEPSTVGRRIGTGVGILFIAALLYYPIGMLVTHKINDDVQYSVSKGEQLPNGSRAVTIAIKLIERETQDSTWTANKPIVFPSSMLDNMPNFQVGQIYAVSRFAIEMTDVLGRTRGTSQVDEDLDKASGLLKYDGTIWHWDPSTSLLPTASAEKQYRAATKSLRRYNERLNDGSAVLDRRADNLIAFLERVSNDLGSVSATLDQRAIGSNLGWFDTDADDIFYSTKGRLYGYYMVLRELGRDFDKVIADRELSASWARMLDSLRQAASLDPIIVVNGAPDGALMPSHLASLGFYLLRARTQLREITNILQK